jgi:predicted ferric reductase
MSEPRRSAPETAAAADVRAPAGPPIWALICAYGALCLLPVLLAAIQGHPLRNVYRELSSGLVMVGYAMMLAQFVLSGRFEWISGRAGIDRTMRFHQLTSWAILAFIVVHPFLYVVPRLSPDPTDAWIALNRMFSSANLRSGVVAWWLMILIVPLAILRDRIPVRYELWRLSHGLMAIAIALFGTHHTLRVGTYSADPLLAGFWIAATGVALLAMVHVYLLKPLLQRREPYRVVANRQVAHRMWEVAVEPERGPAMRFAPGQFVWLNLGHSPFSLTEHPFSISSAPSERPRIAFTIKESGDFTDRIGTVPVGTRAYLDGPHGNFTMTGRDAHGAIFIAGGVGFAPIVGILRQLRAERFPGPLRLIYGNRVEEQILYRDEIEAMKRELDFQVQHVLSEPPAGWTGPTGELTPEVVNRYLDGIGGGDWLHFVCGPPGMIGAIERILQARGIPKRRIVSERFRYD